MQSYNYFSLVRFYPNAPWNLSSWTVDGRVFSGEIPSITALVDSMNRWNPTGRWRHEATEKRIIGGDNTMNYGAMMWVRDGRVVAEMNPNINLLPTSLAVDLRTGFHNLVFTDTTNNCRTELSVEVRCATSACNVRATAEVTDKKCATVVQNGVYTEGGKIALQVGGGLAPYRFRWADLAGTNQPQTRTFLNAGTYEVTIDRKSVV